MSNICGVDICNKAELARVPIPARTKTYEPVSYIDFNSMLIKKGREHLGGFELVKEQHGLARKGQWMFLLHEYKQIGDSSINLAVGARTSYNKLLSNSVAIGGSVQVCSNLMLTGDIFVMRKHTPNVHQDIDGLLNNAFDKAHENYDTALHFQKNLRLTLSDDEAYKILGLLAGNKVLGMRQFKKALTEWHEPSHVEHGRNTAWTLYQAVTESLKSSQMSSFFEKHKQTYSTFKNLFKIDDYFSNEYHNYIS